MPLGGYPNDQPAELASPRLGGVLLDRDVIEGTRRVQSSDGRRSTIDPRRQQPFPRTEMPASREVKQPALDARSLGAKPKGAQGSFLIRKIRRNAPPADMNGASERSVSQPPDLHGENGHQSGPLGDMNRFQQRFPGGENGFQQRHLRKAPSRYTGIQGAEKDGQAPQTRFTRAPISFQARTPKGEGRAPISGRSRTGRSRAPRDSDGSEPRRRQRGVRDGFGRGGGSGAGQEEWTEEEQQYLKEKAERKSQKLLAYEPVEFGRETFTGMGPAFASDEWSMSEMLRERLLLARRHLDMEFIQWDSKEQKADVMAVVEKLKAVRGAKPTDGYDEKAMETTLVSGNGDQQAQALMQKLFGGSYDKFKRVKKKDVFGHVERYVHRNDSYYPDDEKSLLEKVKSILPANRAPSVASGRKEVNA